MGNMKNIVFKEQEGVFVADFASEGNCVIQIDNRNVEPLKIYRHMPEMEPSAYDAIPLHGPYQRVIDLCVPAGMLIHGFRLLAMCLPMIGRLFNSLSATCKKCNGCVGCL